MRRSPPKDPALRARGTRPRSCRVRGPLEDIACDPRRTRHFAGPIAAGALVRNGLWLARAEAFTTPTSTAEIVSPTQKYRLHHFPISICRLNQAQAHVRGHV